MIPLPNPTITVIIPTHNRALLLGKALDSVLAQTLTDWQLIISDDGSNAATRVLISDYIRDHSDWPITCVRSEENRGVAWAIRQAMDQVKTPLFTFLSDDDEYAPTWLEALYRAFDQNPEYDIVYAGAMIEYRDSIFGGLEGEVKEMPLAWPADLPDRNIVWGFMMRTSKYHQIGGWPTRFKIANDWDFFLGAYCHHLRFLRLPDPLYIYRYWKGGHTFTHRMLQLQESAEIQDLYRKGMMGPGGAR